MPTLGQVGYEAYGENRAWKTYDDKPMPQWAELTVPIQQAWEVAVQAGVTAQLSQPINVDQANSIDDSTLPTSVQEWVSSIANERVRSEIGFAVLYNDVFNHGTDGHHRLKIIAMFAKIVFAIIESGVKINMPREWQQVDSKR